MRVIEIGKVLSQSALWPLQRSFYEATGPSAWGAAEVPWWATNNVLLARLYAQILVGFARDLQAQGRLDTSRPLRVLEIAAGTGMLGFRVLQQLDEIDRSDLPADLAFRWILTDGAVSNVEAWARHPQLAPLIYAGRLAIGHFDPLVADRVEVLGDDPITPGDRPLAAVANYAFDCLPADAFLAQDGAVRDARLLLRAPDDMQDPIDWTCLERLDVDYTWHERSETYDDPRVEALIEHYRTRVKGPFLLPIGALRTIDVLTALGAELLLVADHGDVSLEELGRKTALAPLRHGALTFGVNLHAVGRYVREAGGAALLDDPWLAVSVVALLPRAGDWSRTTAAYDAGSGPDSPVRFPYRVRVEQSDLVDVATFATLIEASADDPFVAASLAERVDLSDVEEPLRTRVAASLRRCLAHWMYIPEGTDVPYLLGAMLLDLGCTADAAGAFDDSLRYFGPHPSTLLNRGRCALDQGDLATAVACLEDALALAPDLDDARSLLASLTP